LLLLLLLLHASLTFVAHGGHAAATASGSVNAKKLNFKSI